MKLSAKRFNPEVWAIALILITGGILRFYRFWEIPFTHDELSTYFRLQFDSFAELIKGGVYPDNHPPGIQSFLYFYTNLFGETEWIFKLPFILMGWASLYLVYYLGKLWRNPTAGLLAAAFMACSQYFVMYSQIARPYSAGCFIVLLTAVFWWKYLQHPKKWNIYWPAFALAASLACYTHHLSLLAVFLIGSSGLLFVTRRKVLAYLLACLVIILLYLPNLPIFFIQLNRGGLSEWLGQPDFGFFGNYLKWATHHSAWFSAAILLAIVTGLLRPARRGRYKAFAVGMAWFIASALITYLYSVIIAPILQFSVLIFTFPLALLFIFSAIHYPARSMRIIMPLLILATGTFSLIFGRQHYQIHYENAYRESIKEAQTLQRGQASSIALLGGRADINQYYLDQFPLNESNVVMVADTQRLGELTNLLRESTAQNIYLSATQSSPPAMVSLAHEFFPVVQKRQGFYNGEFYWFSKSGKGQTTIVDTAISFPGQKLTSEVEYACVHDIEHPGKLPIDAKGYVDVICQVESSEILEKAEINLAIFHNDSVTSWRAAALKSFYAPGKDSYPAILSARLFLTDLEKASRIRVQVWNQAGETFTVKSMKLQFRPGNPRLYGQFLPLPK